MTENAVFPGIHPQVNNSPLFSELEFQAIKILSRDWYITRAGKAVISQTQEKTICYNYVLLKPTKVYQEWFNLTREIICLFNSYPSFEPRMLDSLDKVYAENSKLRIQKICCILVNKDSTAEAKIKEILKSEEETQVIVPFSFEELANIKDDFYIRNKFKSNFYTRDLFAFEGPLRKDIYFFGRSELVQEIVSRFRSGENSGVFGLRKSGKTSLIFAIQRVAQQEEIASLSIDCQDTGFNQKKWHKCLWYIIEKIQNEFKIEISTHSEEKFTCEMASDLFRQSLDNFYIQTNKRLLLIFDEIENVTPNISSVSHWESERDFIFFWQTLRSLYQTKNKPICYLLVSTNPMCIEEPEFFGKSNPLFASMAPIYIQPFNIAQTQEMMRRLGRYMGIKFDDALYTHINEDYGGHPYLMRHICSNACKQVQSKERPTKITKGTYTQSKELFNASNSKYFDMIINVLVQHYPLEFDMLKYLALDLTDDFKKIADEHPSLVSHLLGYGLIRHEDGIFTFNIDSLKNYLVNKNKFASLTSTVEERWKEISERRNKFEHDLRQVIKFTLKLFYGEATAKLRVVEVVGVANDRGNFQDLFDPNKGKIYLESLRKIIIKNYDCFKHIFGNNRDKFNRHMETVNEYRKDAHAGNLSHDELSVFRVAMTYLEESISQFRT